MVIDSGGHRLLTVTGLAECMLSLVVISRHRASGNGVLKSSSHAHLSLVPILAPY